MKYVAVISPTECRQFNSKEEAQVAYPTAVVLTDEAHRAKRALELKTERRVVAKQPKNLNWFQRIVLRKKPTQPTKD